MFKYKISNKKLLAAEQLVRDYWNERYNMYNKNKAAWQKPTLDLLEENGFKKTSKDYYERKYVHINKEGQHRYYSQNVKIDWPFSWSAKNFPMGGGDWGTSGDLKFLGAYLKNSAGNKKHIWIQSVRYNTETLKNLVSGKIITRKYI